MQLLLFLYKIRQSVVFRTRSNFNFNIERKHHKAQSLTKTEVQTEKKVDKRPATAAVLATLHSAQVKKIYLSFRSEERVNLPTQIVLQEPCTIVKITDRTKVCLCHAESKGNLKG